MCENQRKQRNEHNLQIINDSSVRIVKTSIKTTFLIVSKRNNSTTPRSRACFLHLLEIERTLLNISNLLSKTLVPFLARLPAASFRRGFGFLAGISGSQKRDYLPDNGPCDESCAVSLSRPLLCTNIARNTNTAREIASMQSFAVWRNEWMLGSSCNDTLIVVLTLRD